MGRPPLGTRWGDLSPEQRAALPVGTRLLAFDGIPELTINGWEWADAEGTFYFYPNPHQLIVYPDPAPEPDPRDSDGPGSDEGGGEMRTGDNDHDGDVPERVSYTGRERQANPDEPSRLRVRFYWPADCEGAEDAPRDCLEGA